MLWKCCLSLLSSHCTWASYLNYSSLSFLIHKVENALSTNQCYSGDWMEYGAFKMFNRAYHIVKCSKWYSLYLCVILSKKDISNNSAYNIELSYQHELRNLKCIEQFPAHNAMWGFFSYKNINNWYLSRVTITAVYNNYGYYCYYLEVFSLSLKSQFAPRWQNMLQGSVCYLHPN